MAKAVETNLRAKLVTALAVGVLWLCSVLLLATPAYAVEQLDNDNHLFDTIDYCMYAHDVSVGVTEIESYATEAEFQQAVLAASNPLVRIRTSDLPYDEWPFTNEYTVDFGNHSWEPSEKYPVTIMAPAINFERPTVLTFFVFVVDDRPEPNPDPTPNPDPDPSPDPTPNPDPTPDPAPDPIPDPAPEPAPAPDSGETNAAESEESGASSDTADADQGSTLVAPVAWSGNAGSGPTSGPSAPTSEPSAEPAKSESTPSQPPRTEPRAEAAPAVTQAAPAAPEPQPDSVDFTGVEAVALALLSITAAGLGVSVVSDLRVLAWYAAKKREARAKRAAEVVV